MLIAHLRLIVSSSSFFRAAAVSRIVLSFIKDVADYINKKLSLDSTYYVMTHPIHFQYFTITIPRHLINISFMFLI